MHGLAPLIKTYFTMSAEEFPMYKYLYHFSTLENLPLSDQDKVEFTPEDPSTFAVENDGSQNKGVKGEGPDMNIPEL